MIPSIITIEPSPKIVVVPSTDPAFGNSGGGLAFATSEDVGVGVDVEAHKQFGDSIHDGVRQRLLEQTKPDAQSLLVTQPLLQPVGGVGVGVAQIQLDEPIHTGLRQRLPLQVRPD
ncbi:MAG: hypothetical protein AAB612_04775 [Patescibacteria group bacterium]